MFSKEELSRFNDPTLFFEKIESGEKFHTVYASYISSCNYYQFYLTISLHLEEGVITIDGCSLENNEAFVKMGQVALFLKELILNHSSYRIKIALGKIKVFFGRYVLSNTDKLSNSSYDEIELQKIFSNVFKKISNISVSSPKESRMYFEKKFVVVGQGGKVISRFVSSSKLGKVFEIHPEHFLIHIDYSHFGLSFSTPDERGFISQVLHDVLSKNGFCTYMTNINLLEFPFYNKRNVFRRFFDFAINKIFSEK